MSSTDAPASPWLRSTLPIALLGSILFWAALPPLALGWLGWIAPVPWLLLVRAESLPGRRPYRSLYLAGFIFWMLTIHWLRLPHPAVYLGWIALSAYLSIYLPVFVGLSRVAVHRLRLPLWLAAPIVWTGLELARAHLLTGFLMASLAHTQVNQTQLIQISDLFGEYGVDFLVMLVAACIASLIPLAGVFPDRAESPSNSNESRPMRPGAASLVHIIPAVVGIAAALLYGQFRLHAIADLESNGTARIALIQGNSLADWKMDLNKQSQIMEEYTRLSKQAVEEARTIGSGQPLDLIVWPETMYRNPLIGFERGFQMPTGDTRTTDDIAAESRQALAELTKNLQTPILVGVDRLEFIANENSATRPSFRAYNSAVLVDTSGKIIGTYDKFHLVMFGEYVPFARWLPFLSRLSSITGNAVAGIGPVTLCMPDVCYAPNICYETVIPHVIRRQAQLLDEAGKPPGVLVNMTNDAWYWGSSELDQHLSCGVFRAIETRKPLVIAANGGISAWIDRAGVVRAQSPKQQPHVIIADVKLAPMTSWYVRLGDWFAGAYLTFTAILAIIGFKTRRQQRHDTTRT